MNFSAIFDMIGDCTAVLFLIAVACQIILMIGQPSDKRNVKQFFSSCVAFLVMLVIQAIWGIWW
jgi:hypothetical protein